MRIIPQKRSSRLYTEQERHAVPVPLSSPNRYAAATPSVHDIPSFDFSRFRISSARGYYTVFSSEKSIRF
jgi:hypothetical protein